MAFNVPINSTAAFNDGASLVNKAAKYSLIPVGTRGIGGFEFSYEGEDRHELRAQVSKHYAENNSSLNEHMALEPEKITLRGYVAEQTEGATPDLLSSFINPSLQVQSLKNKLTVLPAYLGSHTPGIAQKMANKLTQAQDSLNKLNQAYGKARNIMGLIPGLAASDSKQKQAYDLLKALQQSFVPFDVKTPFATLNNMVIEGLVFVQPDETDSWCDIIVSLVELRFAKVDTITYSKAARNGAAAKKPVRTNANSGTSLSDADASVVITKLGTGH